MTMSAGDDGTGDGVVVRANGHSCAFASTTTTWPCARSRVTVAAVVGQPGVPRSAVNVPGTRRYSPSPTRNRTKRATWMFSPVLALAWATSCEMVTFGSRTYG